MTFMNNLCAVLKNYEDVIIYGYGDVGVSILDYIIDLETSIKIANYSGRVKYFATSYEERSMRKEIKGIKIKSIYELQNYAEKALVIVATQEKHHKNIVQILEKLNFKNIILVKHEDYCSVRECIENHRWIINNRIGQYQLNHQIKLERLRTNVRNGKKVKVLFMTHDSAVFGAASVYKAMEKDDLFDPYIYVVSRRDVTYKDFFKDVKRDMKFFEERGYKVICGYDEYQNPRDIHAYAPDIVFYDIPKLYGAAGSFYYRMDRINWEYLTCYIPYGMMMVDSFYYHYHTTCIRETWRFFIDTNDDFKRVMADGDFCGFNMILSGYPKFDDYFINRNESSFPQIDNERPLVIYAPHHSLGVSNNFATFDLYGKSILEFAKQNPNINFVLKPHPLLRFQIRTRYREGIIKISPRDYEEYCKEWKNLPNGFYIEEGEYIDLFRKSCCMITDCGSFIGEYLPSLNPCIYIFNPRKKNQEEVYTPLASKILDSYYVTRTEKELLDAIQNIIIKGNDYKRMIREEVLKSEFGTIGHSGEFICSYLKKVIIGE